MNIDSQDRWQCKQCGQHWNVPSLADDCAKRDLTAAAQDIEWLDNATKVERP